MSSIEGWDRVREEESVNTAPRRRGVLLVGTAKEWFKPALEAVLGPEGFTVLRARDGQSLHELASREAPDLVIVDESLPSTSAPALCESLLSGPLPPSIPLLLYSSDMTTEHVQAEALEAGAWEILREPVRSEHLIATVRRLLALSDLIRSHREQSTDWESGLLTRSGLTRLLPRVEALASRQGVSITFAVVGPTEPGSGDELERQREVTADLCTRHVRRADLCGWINDGDVAIVAFGTTAEGAAVMVRRLDDLSADVGEGDGYGLSAGIVDVRTKGNGGEDRTTGVEDEEEAGESRSFLDAAHTALENARRRGGGIETVEVGDDVETS